MNKKIVNILKEASSIKTKAKRVSFLREHNSLALRDVLKCGFDEKITMRFPDQNPPFDPIDEENASRYIDFETKTLLNFLPNSKMPQEKAELLFISLLETMDENNRNLLLAIKDKSIDHLYKGITREIVEQAFPGLLD